MIFQEYNQFCKIPKESRCSPMVYKCENKDCGFLFSREGEVLRCPVCGKTNLRPATPEEEREFYELLKKDQQNH